MLPPCFRLAERVFPLVRQEAARRMAESGHTQAEIGTRLGVSQAMVSKYLKQQPPHLKEEDEWIVHQMAEEITHLHEQDPPQSDETTTNPWCRTLALTTGEHQVDRRLVVSALLGVLKRLQETDAKPLVPAVGMNLAGALQGARSQRDVAAFPGRLGYVKGRLRAHAPPEFGASNHLARVLIRSQRDHHEVRYAVNLAGTSDILQAARKTQQTLVQPSTTNRDDSGVLEFQAPGPAFALVDPGGFGIEPALYLVDRDATSLARRLEQLAALATKRTGGRGKRA